MHLYWRIQQDLNCLGEILVFHDPRFNRSYREWIQKNVRGLANTMDFDLGDFITPGRN